MSPIFISSYFALWVLFLLQSVLILLLARQVGALHLRIRPSGARVTAAGPDIGEAAPAAVLQDMDHSNQQISVSTSMDKDLLLLFVSPSCAACAPLLPAVRALVQESQEELRWAIVSSGGTESCRTFRHEYRLDSLFFACAAQVRDTYKIGVTPYGVLVGKDGVLLAKGLVNHMEHLESLLDTRSDWRHAEKAVRKQGLPALR